MVLTGSVAKVAHSKQQRLSTEMKIGGALTQQPVLHVLFCEKPCFFHELCFAHTFLQSMLLEPRDHVHNLFMLCCGVTSIYVQWTTYTVKDA